ncbi:phosphatase PAP2 family protein [Mesonia sp.]|uniref:phosphatase PAP2 family protein n=1 Tax=Mesonia sp. TaxID=1960830 RepID=UPI00176E2AFB|nr:phosphatase PAP2 family protein [Mesonia sp.]HIB36469.1 phosphatase PAP2 family protein [Mesonia sp.]HIO27483.1 phosphatase PAP2 family protein [Flavobacteriaceae bacterium]
MFEQLKEWDRELFIYLNGLGIERLDSFWIFITQEENWIPLYLIFIILIFLAYKKKQAFIVLIGFLCSFLVTFGVTRIIKASVARVRPNNVESLQEVIRILQEPTYYSFVSGHTSTSMAITTFMVLILRHRYKWVYIFYLWPILFATSRVYVGVHYPSDLAAGAFVGVIIAIIIYKICKKMLARGDREFDEL